MRTMDASTIGLASPAPLRHIHCVGVCAHAHEHCLALASEEEGTSGGAYVTSPDSAPTSSSSSSPPSSTRSATLASALSSLSFADDELPVSPPPTILVRFSGDSSPSSVDVDADVVDVVNVGSPAPPPPHAASPPLSSRVALPPAPTSPVTTFPHAPYESTSTSHHLDHLHKLASSLHDSASSPPPSSSSSSPPTLADLSSSAAAAVTTAAALARSLSKPTLTSSSASSSSLSTTLTSSTTALSSPIDAIDFERVFAQYDRNEFGVIVSDASRCITHVNAAFEAITGYSRADSIGRTCSFLQGQRTCLGAVARMRDSIERHETCQVAVLNYRKNGQPFWNLLTITPMLDANGLVSGYVGVQLVTALVYVDRPLPIFPWSSVNLNDTLSSKALVEADASKRVKAKQVLLLEGADEVSSSEEISLSTSSTASTTSTTTTSVDPSVVHLPSLLTHATPVAFVAQTHLPTTHGKYFVRAYKDLSPVGKKLDREIMVIVWGDVRGRSDVPVRVHDQCFTSEVLGSLKCDCKEQLDFAMEYIQRENGGIVVYLAQEGRGIGLANKIKVYSVQELGYDTVDANRVLGFPDDLREYTCVPSIFEEMGVRSVRLMTNNPRKTQILTSLGVHVSGRIPVIIPSNPHSRGYLAAKRSRMGHAAQ